MSIYVLNHRERGLDRSIGVVFVRPGAAKGRQDGATSDSPDCAMASLDRGCHCAADHDDANSIAGAQTCIRQPDPPIRRTFDKWLTLSQRDAYCASRIGTISNQVTCSPRTGVGDQLRRPTALGVGTGPPM